MLYFAHPNYCFGASLTFRFLVRRQSSETLIMAIEELMVTEMQSLILKMVSVQETETSDLNKNNNLGEQNTTLQTLQPPKKKNR